MAREIPTCDCIGSYPPEEVQRLIFCLLLAGNALLESIDASASTPPTGLLATQVQGTAADGAAPVGNPVQIGGVDPAGNVQRLQTDTTGALVAASQGYSSQTTITRPANQTPYTAGDVLGGAIEITLIGPSAGRTILTNLALMPQIAAIPTGMTSFRLHLYGVTPPSALADNAVWDLPSGDRASYLGYVDLGSPVDFGSTLFVQAPQVNQEIKLTTTSVFGYLVTNGGFTPAANSEVYRLDTYAVGV